MLKLLVLCVLVSASACISESSFVCEGDSQCVHDGLMGRCEQETKLCSFPSEEVDCVSGFAYGKSAGPLAGTCVPEKDEIPFGCESVITQLSMGNAHGCFLNEFGNVYCWGNNLNGQLGTGFNDSSGKPLQVQLPEIAELSVNGDFSCARETTGRVWCWGLNTNSQLGDGTSVSSSQPRLVAEIDNAVGLASGEAHSCAILDDSTVVCWGRNSDSQLGGGPEAQGNRSDRPIPVIMKPGSETRLLSGVRILVSGFDHSCVATEDNVYCWGSNDEGQLGIDGSDDESAFPVLVTGIPDPSIVEELSAGRGFSCARTNSGDVYCWGANSKGEIGAGLISDSVATATKVSISGATSISSQRSHTCALVSEKVHCWGANENGQIGNSSEVDQGIPVEVMDSAVAVSVGAQHSCATNKNGTLRCWGSDRSGQLAKGSIVYSKTLREVALPPGLVDKLVVSDDHSCALLDGKVYCWGLNTLGQIGIGASTDGVSAVGSPTQPIISDGEDTALGTLGTVTSIVSTERANCAILASSDDNNSDAYCWGVHSFMLGIEGPTTNPVYNASKIGVTVQGLILGQDRVFARTASNQSVCWGGNANGECAIVDSTESSRVPVPTTQFNSLGVVEQIVAGVTHSCGLISGQVHCVGRNTNGSLGDLASSTTLGMSTALVPLSGDAVQLSLAGSYSTCALLQDKSVDCWGSNSVGQLGDGTSSSGAPRKLLLDEIETVVGGDENSCAIRSDGSMWCWGQNPMGSFDIGGANRALSPTQISPGPVSDVGIGRSHLCAVLADDQRVYCLGNNLDGQLGNGRDLGNTLVPTETVITCE